MVAICTSKTFYSPNISSSRDFLFAFLFEAAHTKDVFQILLHAKQVEKSPWPIKRKSLCWALGTALEIYDPRTKFVVQTSNFHGSVFLLFWTSISGGVPKSGLSTVSLEECVFEILINSFKNFVVGCLEREKCKTTFMNDTHRIKNSFKKILHTFI